MVKWTSGRSGRTFNQSAANGKKEHKVPNAALCLNVSFPAGFIHFAAVDSPWLGYALCGR